MDQAWKDRTRVLERGQVFLPFREQFRDVLENGMKTATTRTKAYGKPGDVLDSMVGPLRLLYVEKVTLGFVATQMWNLEGCMDQGDFERVWESIHPGRGFVPEQMVYLHIFERVKNHGEDTKAQGQA